MLNSRADKPLGPYESLSRKAGMAKDDAGIRDLFVEIQRRTLGCDLPKPFLKRLARGESRFQRGKRSAITESELADAVNELGHELNPTVYSGTNALQIHLLRVNMSRQLDTLLAAPASSEGQPESLAPAGAVYMGFLLLRQKLANRAWFGDPVEQNKAWINAESKRSDSPTMEYQYKVTVRAEPVEETNFRLMLKNGLAEKRSETTKAFAEFLKRLGF